MLFFKPEAQTEMRISCPHCERVNEVELKIFSTDRPKEYSFHCKKCLKGFSVIMNLIPLFNIRKDED